MHFQVAEEASSAFQLETTGSTMNISVALPHRQDLDLVIFNAHYCDGTWHFFLECSLTSGVLPPTKTEQFPP